jgi:exopolysaccharide production protein ExoQ
MSYAPTYLSAESALGLEATSGLPGAKLLKFWLPVALFAFALFAAEHSTFYATPGFKDSSARPDLAVEVGGSNLLRQLGYVSLGSIGAAFLLARSPLKLSMNWKLLLLALCGVGWLLLSMVWADNSGLSLKRSMVPLMIFLGSLGLAKHWQPRQLCLFTVVLTSGFLLWGVLAELSYGTFLRGANYTFGGTLHPNNQAINCAALCLASASLYCGAAGTRGWWRQLWMVTFVIGFVLLMLTGSRTTTAAFLVALGVFWMMGASRPAIFWMAGALITFGACFAVYTIENEARSGQAMLELVKMGREQETEDIASLTGRIPIWTEVVKDIAKRPLLGYGNGAFWTPKRVLEYSYIHHWEFNHAHSVYLETMLNIGAIGLTVGIVTILFARRSAARAYRATADPSYRFFTAVLVMALLHGFLDSNFVRGGFASMLALMCVSMMIFHSEPATDA